MPDFKRVPLVFAVLSCVGFYYSQMSFPFVLNEVITRFVRDGVMVLALIIPIRAGMGINFSVVVGALCAQVGLILALDLGLGSMPGLLFMALCGMGLSVVMGLVIGLCLNRVKNREMITTIIIGFLATSIYQLVFMVGYGTVITPSNPAMMLSRGIGIRNMVDLEMFRNQLDAVWLIQLGKIDIPVFMILLVCAFGLVVRYISLTRLGKQFVVVGQSHEKALALGIHVEHVRIKAIVISTLIACLGHLIYILNIGMLNVYTAHMNTDIFSCAALLAGGASIVNARVGHAFLGIFLFHSLFIVSPQAGQTVFGNPALGEYFRSFVAYGTIALALVLNARTQESAVIPKP
ncbi:MAG: ABC transporter permease [Proteobacteria bacterium]|nr:ABC transporter permease [Pseudomonadota bacterium]